MKLKYISWLPAVIIMGVIFIFSSKPVDNSNESSLTIAETILTMYENVSEQQLQEEARTETLDVMNHIVRKGAHFTEYAVLAFAIAFHLWVWKRRGLKRFLTPVLLSALYAGTDEFHQTMVAGRAGMIRDVLLDTLGAVTGMLLFFLILTVFSYRIKKSNKKITSPQ